MSEIDRQVVKAIVAHGGSVSRFELMSLLGGLPDSEIDLCIKRLEEQNLVKITNSGEASDPLITIKEIELERRERVA
jgi:uncharacterized membrane protein